MILGFYFVFVLYIQSLFNLDDSFSIDFTSMIIGVILIGIGTFVFVYPNQKALSQWGYKKSFETVKTLAESMPKPAISDFQIRLCVKCGRNIPFDAKLCPYCGHDYRD